MADIDVFLMNKLKLKIKSRKYEDFSCMLGKLTSCEIVWYCIDTFWYRWVSIPYLGIDKVSILGIVTGIATKNAKKKF